MKANDKGLMTNKRPTRNKATGQSFGITSSFVIPVSPLIG